MADHEHNWQLSHYIFPEQGDANYEHEEPYRVEICDPECGQRRTVLMEENEIDSVRKLYSIPAESIVYSSNKGGEDE